jgi:hypothetical protein
MSRLENTSQIIRDQLISRNRYNPSDIYDINNSTVVDIINTTSRILRPGNGFDFSNTVIGRIVGPQTPIAKIGNEALVNLYTEQVKSTIVRKNVPTINLNNLFNGKSIFKDNVDYSITKDTTGSTTQEKIFNLIKDYSGANSLLNPIPSNVRTADLITKYTGEAQLNILSNLLSNNIYYNDFNSRLQIDNSKNISITKESKLSNTSLASIIYKNFNLTRFDISYLDQFYTNKYLEKNYPISDDNNQQDINATYGETYNFEYLSKISNEDIVSLNKAGNTITWGLDNNTSIQDSIGILGYTNALFQTLKSEGKATFDKSVSQITVNGKTYYNGIKYGDRSYSVNNQMDGISKTIRPYGNGRKNSVIKNSIIPKFIYKNDIQDGITPNTVMFSIENLAIDSKNININNQKGPNKGRIMWFVPSITDFNEDVTTSITPTNFLGRGEPVYTYANTERKLTLSFYMVVDHAKDFIGVSSFQDFQNRLYSKQLLNSQQTGNTLIVLNEDLKLKEEKRLELEKKKYKNKNTEFTSPNLPINLFYPVNTTLITIPYESYNDSFDDQLNNLFGYINNNINSNPTNSFDILINATVHDTSESPEIVHRQRLEGFKGYINNFIQINYPNLIKNINIISEEANPNSLIVANDATNSEVSAKKRKASIISVISNLSESEIIENIPEDLTKSIDEEMLNLQDFKVDTLDLGSTKDLNDVDPNIDLSGSFNKILTKTIQNGITTYSPEDLYDRLTFLHQCTRQGATNLTGDDISNSVFGRPPVIVFKLGDIYNTKAMITSLNISFENELPWDLNPEGFGVQKMGCKVTMNMNLIGGSSIDGPKSHILNADSKRFYANSSYEALNLGKTDDKLDKEERL